MNRPTRRGLVLAAASLPFLRPLSSPALAQDARQVLTFAAVTFTEAGRGDKLRAWVETFNKSQDRVQIQPVGLPFATLANTVFTQMGGGGGPDLVRFDQIDYHAAIAARRILPYTDLIDTRDYRFTATDKYMIVDNVRYGITFESSNYVLLYNKALLKDGPPTGFDDFLAKAKAATADGAYGFAFRATMAERPGFWQDVCNFVYGFGGRWSDESGALTLDAPGVIEGVTAYKRVYDANVIPKGADAATYRRMFWEGKLGMEVDNGGVAAILNQQAPALPLAAVSSPFPTRSQGAIVTPLTVNANTKRKEEVAIFIRWMLQPEPQRELQRILGASNVATVVERRPEELSAQPWLKVYDDQTPNSLPQLVTGYEVKTPEVQQIVLEQVLRVLQANKAPREAMADAQRQAVSRIRR